MLRIFLKRWSGGRLGSSLDVEVGVELLLAPARLLFFLGRQLRWVSAGRHGGFVAAVEFIVIVHLRRSVRCRGVVFIRCVCAV